MADEERQEHASTNRSAGLMRAVGLLIIGAGVGMVIGWAVSDQGATTVDTQVAGTSVERTTTTVTSTTSMPDTPGMDHGSPTTPAERPNVVEFQGAERDALADQLTIAREVALRFPTLADAEAGGFEPTTPFTPGLGAHMGRDDWTQQSGVPLDLGKPQSYLYDGTGPDAELVGIMYVVTGGDQAPDGFAGPLDPWHAVHGSCLKADELDPLFPAADGITKDTCERAGGRFIDITVWTQHVWVVPGWEAPGGVFADHNADIVCADGTTDSDPVAGCASPVAR